MQRDALLTLLSSVGISVDEVTGDEVPLTKYGLNSLAAVQLLIALENAIAVAIPDDFFEYQHFETIASLEHMIQMLEDTSI